MVFSQVSRGRVRAIPHRPGRIRLPAPPLGSAPRTPGHRELDRPLHATGLVSSELGESVREGERRWENCGGGVNGERKGGCWLSRLIHLRYLRCRDGVVAPGWVCGGWMGLRCWDWCAVPMWVSDTGTGWRCWDGFTVPGWVHGGGMGLRYRDGFNGAGTGWRCQDGLAVMV